MLTSSIRIGILKRVDTTPPIAPVSRPSRNPVPSVTAVGELLTYRFAAKMPPPITQAQHAQLKRLTGGTAERIPNSTPPISAGFNILF
jgi:hypothetical protein